MTTEPWADCLMKCVYDACASEVMSIKPGNVSPQHQFEDSTANDFLRSARAIAPILAATATTGVGKTVFDAAMATQQAVGHNTNLGIILLLTPLAAVPRTATLQDGIETVLSGLTVEDARLTYLAIRAASPSGLGTTNSQDVSDAPTDDLRACMKLAADRDLIAKQYSSGFRDVLELGPELLEQTRDWNQHQQWVPAWIAINLMARFGDSLIARKCGPEINNQVRQMAEELMRCGWPLASGTDRQYELFDQFLRADGHQRNPGTTADMIAAILFAAFRDDLCSDVTSHFPCSSSGNGDEAR